MKEQLISFETAKLAKEKGFNELVRSAYIDTNLLEDSNTKGNYNNYKWVSSWRNSPNDDAISAPTQSLLQKWLREKYRLHINLIQTIEDKYTYTINIACFINRYGGVFKTYEEALEKGLQEALKQIK